MTCCEECAYPGNPGVCVRRETCPCHDTEDDDPVAERLARVAAQYAADPEEAEALTRAALARLESRRKRSGKTCARCREFKPMSAYGFSARETDGLNRTCKSCRNTYERERVND